MIYTPNISCPPVANTNLQPYLNQHLTRLIYFTKLIFINPEAKDPSLQAMIQIAANPYKYRNQRFSGCRAR